MTPDDQNRLSVDELGIIAMTLHVAIQSAREQEAPEAIIETLGDLANKIGFLGNIELELNKTFADLVESQLQDVDKYGEQLIKENELGINNE